MAMRSFALYFLARLGILAACVAVVWLIMGPSLYGMLGAVLIATLISYLALGRLRDEGNAAVAARVEDRLAARQERRAAKSDARRSAEAEDAEIDRAD